MVWVATRSGSTSSRSADPPLDRPDDLVDVDRLRVAVALAYPHRCLRLHRHAVTDALFRYDRHTLSPRELVHGRGGARETPTATARRPGCWRRPSRATSDRRTREARGALAGLRTRGHDGLAESRLPAVASQARGPVLVTAVVPTYRCGAVPDFHRVPSCLGPAPEARPNQLRHHHIWGRGGLATPDDVSACRMDLTVHSAYPRCRRSPPGAILGVWGIPDAAGRGWRPARRRRASPAGAGRHCPAPAPSRSYRR